MKEDFVKYNHSHSPMSRHIMSGNEEREQKLVSELTQKFRAPDYPVNYPLPLPKKMFLEE